MVGFIILDTSLTLKFGFEKDVFIILNEIYDPFIFLFFVMWIVCWINGWLEGKAKEKEEEKKYEDYLREQFHKEDFLEMSRRLGLKETPHNMLEMFHIAKKEGKGDKVSRVIAEVMKEDSEEKKKQHK